MVVLDTDHISILVEQQSSEAQERLTRRLSALAPAEVVSTIVTYDEQSRGWLAYVAKATTVVAQVIDRYQAAATDEQTPGQRATIGQSADGRSSS